MFQLNGGRALRGTLVAVVRFEGPTTLWYLQIGPEVEKIR